MQQNRQQCGWIDEQIVVCITLESDWVNALTSHDEDESNITSQLVLFDFINFIDDSFHLACQVDEKFLNIW